MGVMRNEADNLQNRLWQSRAIQFESIEAMLMISTNLLFIA